MPEIRPFRGILYNSRKVKLDNVVAPPYDVITPQQQEELSKRDPHNIVRVILGQAADQYSAAAKYFEDWKSDRVMIADEEPTIYVLSQAFSLTDGRQVERTGFLAACKLEEFGRGSVFPHEKTLSGPKEDRLRLFHATGAMFSQIFSLYADPMQVLDEYLREAMTVHPVIDTVFENVRSRLWKMTDRRGVGAITQYIKNERVFVADGHHRYETALLYRNAQRATHSNYSGSEPFNFVPMFFTNMSDPGLVIYPTHRLLHSLNDFEQTSFLTKLTSRFTLEVHNTSGAMLQSLEKQSRHSFGLVLNQEPCHVLLQLGDRRAGDGVDVPEVLAQLDVTILHTGIFKNILCISDDDQIKKRYLDYEKDERLAIQAVQSGKAQAAFLMNATRVDQVRAVAEAGYTMPQKSTYFYPKLLSGVVTYSFLQS